MAHGAISEAQTVAARIKPQSVTAAATAESDVVDMKNFKRLLALINLGDYAAGNDGSISGGLYYDTASGGSFANLITGKSITTALFTGSALDDAMSLIEIRDEELVTLGQTVRYVKLKLTPANQNMTLSAVLLAGGAIHGPASQFDLAAVKEILNT